MRTINKITQEQKNFERTVYDFKHFLTSEFESVNNFELIEVVEEMIKKNDKNFFTIFGEDESIISIGQKLNSGIFDENYMVEADVYLVNHNKKWYRVITGQAYKHVEIGDSEDDDDFVDYGSDYSVIIDELMQENPAFVARFFVENFGSDAEIVEWNKYLI